MTISLASQQSADSVQSNLGEVFCDIKTHQEVSDIIRKHMTNTLDIRELALDNICFTDVNKIIDLGCGFGFFTRGLKGKVKRSVDIVGIDRHSKCKDFYLDSCEYAGLKGQFLSNGIEEIESITDNSVDLVICSYALYFFPEYIKQIARVLKDNGSFVVITHSYPHMVEFTTYVKTIIRGAGFDCDGILPYEELITGFSDENGLELLSNSFVNITSKRVQSSLLFNYNDFHCFEKYFRFKQSFFIPPNDANQNKIRAIILENLKADMKNNGEIEISKADMIFICQKSHAKSS